MQLQEQRYYSPEEYLELETAADYKSEYYDGQILPMAGASINHNRIVRNFGTILNASISPSYEVFMSDMRLWIPNPRLYTYPDVMVISGQPNFTKGRNDTITNPLVIVEVLLESTKNYDRGEKFEFYRTIPSLEEYIIVDQYKIHIEQFSRTADGKWLLSEYKNADALLELSSVQFQVALVDIYNRVEF